MDISVTDITITPADPGSKWNAVRNPIAYQFLRKDYLFDQIVNSGGQVQLQFNGVDLTSEIEVDDSVYYRTESGNASGSGVVTVSAFSGGNTLITLDRIWSATDIGYMNNITKRPAYALEVNVFQSGGTLLTPEPLIFTPNSIGLIIADISSAIDAQLSEENNAPFSLMSWPGSAVYNDVDVYESVYIKYRETWIGSSEDEITDADTIIGVGAGMQIPSQYGGNMLSFLTEWLTVFDRPVMWRGYPFTLSCIIDGVYNGDNVRAIAEPTGETPEETTPSTAYGDKVLQVDFSGIDNIDDGEQNEFKASMSDGTNTIINEKTVDVRTPSCNSIYVLGRNKYGGVLWWMFESNQEYEVINNNGKKAKRLRLFTENLTVNQWEALQDFIALGESYTNPNLIFDSSVIKNKSVVGQQLYVVEPDGTKIGVISIPIVNLTNTRQVKHSFEMVIEYPYEY